MKIKEENINYYLKFKKAGEKLKNFYDIIEMIKKYPVKPVKNYQSPLYQTND